MEGDEIMIEQIFLTIIAISSILTIAVFCDALMKKIAKLQSKLDLERGEHVKSISHMHMQLNQLHVEIDRLKTEKERN